MRNGSGSTFSVIGSDVVITGNISATVDLHVDGKIDGDISCSSLVQGPDSAVSGAITAETARLAGKVDGSIDAKELVIEASAHISGDIAYETLSIEQGGHVDGQFRHKSAQMASKAAAAKPVIDTSETLILES
jgi:cytoskeletal protein CcmA (bactofilin family)